MPRASAASVGVSSSRSTFGLLSGGVSGDGGEQRPLRTTLHPGGFGCLLSGARSGGGEQRVAETVMAGRPVAPRAGEEGLVLAMVAPPHTPGSPQRSQGDAVAPGAGGEVSPEAEHVRPAPELDVGELGSTAELPA